MRLRIPYWSEQDILRAQAVPLAAAQQDAERALLQAIAAHVRAAQGADADPARQIGYAVALGQLLRLIRQPPE